jgi:hypothetical protein
MKKKITRRQAVKQLAIGGVSLPSSSLLFGCGAGSESQPAELANERSVSEKAVTSISNFTATAGANSVQISASVAYTSGPQPMFADIRSLDFLTSWTLPATNVIAGPPAGKWTGTQTGIPPGTYHTRIIFGSTYAAATGSALGPDVVVSGTSVTSVSAVTASVGPGAITIAATGIQYSSAPQPMFADIRNLDYTQAWTLPVTNVVGGPPTGTWTATQTGLPPGTYHTRLWLSGGYYSGFVLGPDVVVPSTSRTFDLTPNIYGQRPAFGWPTLFDQAMNVLVESETIVLTGLSATTGGAVPITTIGAYYGIEIRKNAGAWGTVVSVVSGDAIQIRTTTGGLNARLERVIILNGNGNPTGPGVLAGSWFVRTNNRRVGNSVQTWQVGAGRTYTTLAAVMPNVRAGDTVEVDSGQYIGSVVWDRSGTSGLPIKIKKAATALTRPELFASSGGIYQTIRFNADYVTFEGFDVHSYVTGSYNYATAPTGTATEPGSGVRHSGHEITIRDCYLHDCRDLVLSHDDYSGSLTIENCFGERSGGLPVGDAAYSHGFYVTTNQIAFPSSRVRIIGCWLRNICGNGIKNRSPFLTVAYTRIEMANQPESFYAIQLTGPQGPDANGFHAADVLGCIIKMSTNTAPINVGGDGTSADARNNVRIAKNTFSLPIGHTQSVIYTRLGLRSVLAIDNAVLRSDGSSAITPLTNEYEVNWTTGRKVVSIKNALPAIPAVVRPTSGGADIPLVGGSFVANSTSIVGIAAMNVTRATSSVLTGSGTNLLTYATPSGYELSSVLPLEPFNKRAPAIAPVWGTSLTLANADPATLNVGAA